MILTLNLVPRVTVCREQARLDVIFLWDTGRCFGGGVD
jgi:hypothetical protein